MGWALPNKVVIFVANMVAALLCVASGRNIIRAVSDSLRLVGPFADSGLRITNPNLAAPSVHCRTMN
jgi:hypothetical protein